jgi:hypothetical protein
MKSSSPQKPAQDMEIKAGIIPGEEIIVEGGKIAAIVKISLNAIFQSPSYRNYFVKWSK